MRKLFIAIVAVAALIGFLAAGAQAAEQKQIEYCPVQIGGTHHLNDAGRSLYSFGLHAPSGRIVSGTILAQTDAGWFTFPFKDVTLNLDAARYKSSYTDFTRNDYVSNELFVAFPPSVTKVEAWFVDRAQSTGDDYGWEAKGSVPCSPLAGTGLSEHKPPARPSSVRTNPNPLDLSKSPAGGDAVATASPADAPEGSGCSVPAKQAVVTAPSSPEYPRGYRISQQLTSKILIAVSAAGIIDGATVYEPSGVDAFDDAALRAARRSSYAGGTAYCKPAPGFYIFSATFMPGP